MLGIWQLLLDPIIKIPQKVSKKTPTKNQKEEEEKMEGFLKVFLYKIESSTSSFS